MGIFNKSIAARIMLFFGLILGFLILSSSVSLYQSQSVADDTRKMMDLPLKKERMAADWYRYTFAGIRRTMAIAKSSDPSLVDFFVKDTKFTQDASIDLRKKLTGLADSEEEKTLLKNLEAAGNAYLDARALINKAKGTNDQIGADRLLKEVFVPAADKYSGLIGDFESLQRKKIDSISTDISRAHAQSVSLTIGIDLLAIGVSFILAFLFSRKLLRQLGGEPDYATAIAQRIARGELDQTITVKHGDTSSLVYAMEQMRSNLAGIVSQVRNATESIQRTTQQLADDNTDLSKRTEAQAENLEKTASSMEELVSAVSENARNAVDGETLAESACGVASKGGSVVEGVVSTMKKINDSSKNIADIISVIDGIAFQTNILALNAAVEAARAGEQGRGFAVVATEVRNLAQRSASAAKEIKTLITSSVETVNEGAHLVKNAGDTMQEILESINRVTTIMRDFSVSSNEQSNGLALVNDAIMKLDEVTQKNLSSVEAATNTANVLRVDSERLASAVSLFKI